MKPSIIAPREDHGTRACYVGGCRCDDCRAANRDRYRDRMERMRELAAEVQPTGPGIPSTMRRGGRDVAILRCAGANGAACIAGGAWLKGREVCGVCLERATVWDGLVPCDRVRAHLRALSSQGVGYKAVAAACDVAETTLSEVLAGERMVRASTERRVLSVDAGAISDGALVDASSTNERIASILARGFARRHVAELLGYANENTGLQVGDTDRVTAAMRARVERLWRRVEAGEVVARHYLLDVADDRAWLVGLLERGVPARWLSVRAGFAVHRSLPERMTPTNAARLRAFRAEIEELRREGGEMPEGWESAGTSGITSAFGFEGGWSWGGASPGGRAPKKPKPRKATRPPPLTPEQRRERDREGTRARRAAMEPAELRARNREDQRRKRARDRAGVSRAA